MPSSQKQRNLIAKMKLIPVDVLIRDKKLLLIDDSIVRGTQLGETTEFLYESGAKEVHVRPACPPITFGCPYLNFSRSRSAYDLITRRVIRDREGENVSEETLATYTDPDLSLIHIFMVNTSPSSAFSWSWEFNTTDTGVKGSEAE